MLLALKAPKDETKVWTIATATQFRDEKVSMQQVERVKLSTQLGIAEMLFRFS